MLPGMPSQDATAAVRSCFMTLLQRSDIHGITADIAGLITAYLAPSHTPSVLQSFFSLSAHHSQWTADGLIPALGAFIGTRFLPCYLFLLQERCPWPVIMPRAAASGTAAYPTCQGLMMPCCTCTEASSCTVYHLRLQWESSMWIVLSQRSMT